MPTDLIFQPFQLGCPQCRKYVELSFEGVQYNDELTCLECENIFTPNLDAQALLALVKLAEASLAERKLAEKELDKYS